MKHILKKTRLTQADHSAIHRYSVAMQSDPFAAARAVTHLQNGTADPGDYDAEIEVHNDGTKTFKNVRRA